MTSVEDTPEQLLSEYRSLFYASEKKDEIGFQKIKKQFLCLTDCFFFFS